MIIAAGRLETIVPTTAIEGCLLPYGGEHAANARRELRFFDVQFDIGRKLSVMAVRTQIVRTRNGDLAHSSQHGLGAQFLIAGSVTASAGNAALLSRRDGEVQQLAEGRGSGVVHGGSQGHLGSLQIEAARLSALLEDHAQELVYFARDFPADRLRRFFSSGVKVSSMGRKRQICPLTSTSS